MFASRRLAWRTSLNARDRRCDDRDCRRKLGVGRSASKQIVPFSAATDGAHAAGQCAVVGENCRISPHPRRAVARRLSLPQGIEEFARGVDWRDDGPWPPSPAARILTAPIAGTSISATSRSARSANAPACRCMSTKGVGLRIIGGAEPPALGQRHCRELRGGTGRHRRGLGEAQASDQTGGPTPARLDRAEICHVGTGRTDAFPEAEQHDDMPVR
jgi:hypothetical protein